ncbi:MULTISPECIES: phospholipase D family protein [Sphingomonadaceae]|uniref:Phospholipase D n=1 Tax=Sphingobium wenxiniae (strain DSM 21828 / CGMCC 1.7748 / JZ-1) TaxID=595605 RepID=A0A562K1W0_SPHWJ|nr:MULTISPECIES: phospholipase D family protein [Sphingomonadaceae]MBB6193655.1 putative cardiolipin synthase [Sphingobium wenxiniae]TWH89417.1 putative cardiolipin synthase [Sphingobium wenxiniae]
MVLVLQWLGGLALLLLAVGIAIRLAYPLPALEPRAASAHIADTGDTPLGRGVALLSRDRDGHSGIHQLNDGRDAFAARILLARAAVRSLDIQYYIWHGDRSGTLLLEAVHEATDRGVRVRMLLDDNGIAGMDNVLAALDRHPNIEIRLFNPFVLRRPKMLGYLADFPRLNRRMHNKSFTADNQATIIGGRNIGDEYFGARDEGLFLDLDVLAIGPIVEDVSRDFDRYWSSESAYPAARILLEVPSEELKRLSRQASLVERDPAARAYVEAIRSLPFIDQTLAGTLPLEWAPVRMVSDDPAKGVGKARREALLAAAVHDTIGEPQRDTRLISGYFVPGRAGVDALAALSARGVDVAIFTNAFESTDVWIVHAGYAERRKPLLKAGVRLFEMRGPDRADGKRPRRSLISTGSGSGGGSDGPVLRSSASMLHAKTFSVDGQRLFVGSFNFDPRSIHLNTELGFVIESPSLAANVSNAFLTDIPANAYEVVLAEDGRLNWLERTSDGVHVHTSEPGTSRWQRGAISILSKMPIEWLL